MNHFLGKPSVVALIPARSGSERIPGKNIKLLNGHPLIAYTICAARKSGIFSRIVVSTDSKEYTQIALHYGAEAPSLRPSRFAGKNSPDIEWVRFVMDSLDIEGDSPDCFSILRPTSPFRLPGTICRAWDLFLDEECADSLRAVQKCREHPAKMWRIAGNRMNPLIPFSSEVQPWHSCPYQELPEVYVQNASLEIAWTRVLKDCGNISGSILIPFITLGYEGFDLNTPEDWERAISLFETGRAELPVIDEEPYML